MGADPIILMFEVNSKKQVSTLARPLVGALIEYYGLTNKVKSRAQSVV